MAHVEKTVESTVIYDGKILRLLKDKAEVQSGHIVGREVVVHPGGVGIVPLDDEGNVYMVRQFRYPLMGELLEIPAGKLEYGEDPYECAVRELKEETGFEAEEFISLGSLYPSPGYCRETLYVYLARGLKAGEMHLDEDEFLDVEKYPLAELSDMVMRGELRDAKTVIGILKTLKYLESL